MPLRQGRARSRRGPIASSPSVKRAYANGSGKYLWSLAVPQIVIISLLLVACGKAATVVPTPLETSRPVGFITEDGVAIRGRLFGQGRTGVVLAHMYPSDQTSWWGFAQVLAEQGYIALTFDFRGYGDTGGDKEISLIDRDMEAAVRFLREQGGTTVFLAGASMGGTVALKVAGRGGVAGVVSLSAPVEFKGISVKTEQITVPALLMAAKGDGSATNTLNSMTQDGILGDLAETVLYEKGSDHGTDILKGENADAARERILGFLLAHQP